MAADEALNALSTTDASNTPADDDVISSSADDELRSIKANIARSARWEVTATQSANFTLPVTGLHKVYPVKCDAGARVVTLPAASTAGDGFQCLVHNVAGALGVSIARAGSDSINGTTSYTLTYAGDKALIVCDGTNAWTVFTHRHGVQSDSIGISGTPMLFPGGVLATEAIRVSGTAGGGEIGVDGSLSFSNSAGLYLTLHQSLASGGAATLNMVKSRAGAIVQNGDVLGNLTFFGHDQGGTAKTAANIIAYAGTASGSNVPGSLTFWTTDDAGSSTKALDISKDRKLTASADVSIEGDFSVSGSAHFNGRVSFNDAISVSGSSYLAGWKFTSTAATVSASAASVPQLVLANTVAGTGAGFVILRKSRAGAAVQLNDTLGALLFQGADTDGTMKSCAFIAGYAGTVSGSAVASRLSFNVTDGDGAAVEAFRLKPDSEAVLYGAVSVSGRATFNGGTNIAAGPLSVSASLIALKPIVAANLATYDTEASASTAGLASGTFYKTAAGALRVKL